MNTLTQNARPCPACHQASLVEATREKHFSPLGETVSVLLRVSRCPACGAELINAEQRRENLQRLRARKARYGHLLLGEEIVALRKNYGLTQQAAAKIFGKGKIAFSRYENETSYPDQSTTKLLKRAIAQPQVLKALADEEGVEIPLWRARLEEEQREIARLMSRHDVPEPSHVWQRAVQKALSSADRESRRSGAFEVTFAPRQAAMPAQNDVFSDEAMAA